MTNKYQAMSRRAPLPAGAYSHGIIAGDFMFTSGFGPGNPVNDTKPAGIADQTRATLGNISAVLAESGLGLSDIVKVTVHLKNLKEDFRTFDKAYRDIMSDPLPARTTVGSDLNDILVEIDVIALMRE